MGRPVGIEPTSAGATIRCVNPFATAAIYGRGSRNRTHIDGFGDRSSTVKLYPYYNIKMVEGGRFELPNPEGADLQSAAFSHFATPPTNGGSGRNRTADTRIFSPLLYRLSYRAIIMESINLEMAVRTGLEPATSCVTGRHSNQLNYRTIFGCGGRI